MKKIRCLLFCLAFLGASSFAMASAEVKESALSLMNFEGFGSMAFQTITGAGSSFAGGAHYAPSYRLSDMISAKLLLGPQTFKSTSNTGSSTYVVLDYLAAAQLDVFRPLAINVGAGGGTDLRSGGKTRAGLLLGAQYAFEQQKLLGVFDHMFANAHYYLSSSDLWVIHYGLGISL